MKIDNDVANVLINSNVKDNLLYLPPEQLERSLYLRVNKVLQSLGGKWNRKLKSHVFEKSPESDLENIILTGEYTDAKQEYQFFETPENIALQIIEMAEIKDNETILEPSAGKGAIAKFIKKCNCVELNKDNRKYLVENDFNLVWDDFLTFNKKYDVIIANPPFTKQQDIDHVNHMIELANKRVISIMSFSVLFRTNKKTIEFRNLIESLGGEFIELPEKSFARSGTNVNACIVSIKKERRKND
jgi:type I restriction-modification system DNA methylase subunit